MSHPSPEPGPPAADVPSSVPLSVSQPIALPPPAPPIERAVRAGERGAAVVEWLGISALSIAMLVVMFAALQQVGVDLVNDIRGSLGL